MKNNCVICRYGELGLKGENRHFFEKRLVLNIKQELKKKGINAEIKRVRGRLLIYTLQRLDFLKNIFGLVSFSHAAEIDPDIEEVKKAVYTIDGLEGKKFRITAKRLEKIIDKDSMEIQKELGAFVVQQKKAKVDLVNYDVEIAVEFFNNKAYLFTERISAFGGLPAGVEGDVFIEIKNEKDVLAVLLMLKRGCRVFYESPSGKIADKLDVFENGRNIIKTEVKPKYSALVSSDNYANLFNIKEDKEFTLRPLALYTDKEIEKQLARFLL